MIHGLDNTALVTGERSHAVTQKTYCFMMGSCRILIKEVLKYKDTCALI